MYFLINKKSHSFSVEFFMSFSRTGKRGGEIQGVPIDVRIIQGVRNRREI